LADVNIINDPEAFGNTKGSSGTGCKDTPYEFHFAYNTTPGTSFPRVQVLDNWGWCSGECKDAANGALYSDNEINYGCYADLSNRNDCDSSDKAWVNYNGNVIVE